MPEVILAPAAWRADLPVSFGPAWTFTLACLRVITGWIVTVTVAEVAAMPLAPPVTCTE